MKQNATLDSSFWVNVHRSGLLPYVLRRYAIRYAPAVAVELDERFASGREFWRLARAGLLEEAAPQGQRVQDFGVGERAALNLAVEHPDWILLLDDRRPFEEAVRLHVRVVCSPVFALALFHEGQLGAEQVFMILARLAALQTVSPHLLAMALADLGKSLKGT